jgi:hypothetical protein
MPRLIVRLWCDGRGTMTRRADSSSRATLRWPSRFGGRGTSTAARLGQPAKAKPGRPTTCCQCRQLQRKQTNRQPHVWGGPPGAPRRPWGQRTPVTPPWCCGVPFNVSCVRTRAHTHTHLRVCATSCCCQPAPYPLGPTPPERSGARVPAGATHRLSQTAVGVVAVVHPSPRPIAPPLRLPCRSSALPCTAVANAMQRVQLLLGAARPRDTLGTLACALRKRARRRKVPFDTPCCCNY